ncbi:MAG: putative amidohydrolase [Bacteriovoracaceae bacterium]
MKVALIQICSVLDPKVNLAKIKELITKAKKEDPNLEAVFLPEVFYSMSNGEGATPYLVEPGNEHYDAIKNIAIDHNLYLLGGTAATNIEGKVLNRSYNFTPKGELLAHYDKIHLFAVDLKGKTKSTILDEAKVYTAGNELKTFDIGPLKFGLTICFDLRFPELFRKYYTQGVNVFTISSAFTVPTGRAHWLTLLKARAIENQAYVIACDQWGEHNEKIQTYGHSYIIDPWGEIIADCGEGETYSICELKIERINHIRGRLDMTPRLD